MTVHSRGTALRGAALLGSVAFMLAACSGGNASPDAGAPVVVTFEFVDERF